MRKNRSGSKAYGRSMSRAAVAAFMASSLGEARSQELVDETARQLGISADDLDCEQAHLIFESLAERGGTIATVARFAKARFILTAAV
jgi:hypothetical protein